MKLKKVSSLLLVTMLILAGCGGSDASSDNAASSNSGNTENASTQISTEADITENNTEAAPALSGYVFSYNDVDFTVDMEAAPVIIALGPPASHYEVPSCAFEGMERIYDYTSFEITTYEVDDVDYIANIYLKDDLVSTPEGISLFMTSADLVEAYGEDYTASEGQYVFTKDNTKLIVIVNSDLEIISIQYGSTFLD